MSPALCTCGGWGVAYALASKPFDFNKLRYQVFCKWCGQHTSWVATKQEAIDLWERQTFTRETVDE